MSGELVPLEDIALRLRAAGVPNETIAAVTGQSVPSITRITRQRSFIPEDQQLAEAARRLAWKVHAKANHILDHGHPSKQMEIIKIVLGRTAGLIGEETQTSVLEQKASLEALFASMRNVPTGPSYVESSPPLIELDDSGQEVEGDEDPLRPDPAFDRW